MAVSAHTNHIAVIGATQSGKTTLALGLSEQASVMARQDMVNALASAKKTFDNGKWPDGTNRETFNRLTCDVKFDGDDAEVSFCEYAGEKLFVPTFAQNVVGSPIGALLLLNPGMDILGDDGKRKEMAEALKRIVVHLKQHGCVAIALVITASDRLKTDLKDMRGNFDIALASIREILETQFGREGKAWRQFEVTVTGELESQDNPNSARSKANTSGKPFLWVLEQIRASTRGQKNSRVMSRIGKTVAALVVMGALVCCALFVREFYSLKTIEKKAGDAITAFETAQKELNIGGEKEAFDALRGCIEELSGNGFLSNRKGVDCTAWNAKHAEMHVAWLEARIRKLEKDGVAPDACGQIDEELERIMDEGDRTRLTGLWREIKPQAIRKRASVEAEGVLEKLRKLAPTEKSDNIQKTLRNAAKFVAEYPGQMDMLLNVESERDAFIARFKESVVEKWVLSKGKLTPFDDAEKARIRESLDIGDNGALAQSVIRELEDRHAEKENAAEAEKLRVSQEFIDKFLKFDRSELFTRMLGAFNGYEEWYGKNVYRGDEDKPFVKMVDEYMADLLGKYFSESVLQYERDFCGEKSVWVDSGIKVRVADAQRRFNDFDALCRSVANPDKECGLGGTPALEFARRYAGLYKTHKDAFVLKIAVSRIEAMLDCSDFPTNYKCTKVDVIVDVGRLGDKGYEKAPNVKKIAEGIVDETANRKWHEIWKGNATFEAKPFERTSFIVKATDCNKWIGSPDMDSFKAWPINDLKLSGQNPIEVSVPTDISRRATGASYDTKVRIFYNVEEGYGMSSLYSEVFGK